MRTSPAARCTSRQHEQVQGQCRQNTLNLGSKCNVFLRAPPSSPHLRRWLASSTQHKEALQGSSYQACGESLET